MLVITRKTGEGIVVDEKVKLTVLEVSKDRVKIGIEAPKDVKIVREELFDTKEQNVAAASSPSKEIIDRLMKK